jgi:hypothetical protein
MLRLLQSKRKRDIISFVATGVAAVATAGWVVYKDLSHRDGSDEPSPIVIADHCSVATGGSISAQVVTAGCSH